MNATVADRPMLGALAGRDSFRLGNATIDPVSREGRWDGGKERLQPLTLKVLLVLRSRRGEVVTRDDLTQLCWDGRIVGDDVINRSISLLRHFAERAGGFEIETVPRAGYRLIEHCADRRVRRLTWAIAAAVIAAAVAAAAYFTPRQPAVGPAPLTVAIHSFTAPSGDSASTDLAVEASNAMARMLTESGISVIDANSTDGPVQADFILTGSIGPTANGHIATIRLEEPNHHSIVMTRQVESTPTDPEALPDQIGAATSSALSAAAPLIRLDRAYPSDPGLLAHFLNQNASSAQAQSNFEIARRTAPDAPNSVIAQLTMAIRTGMDLSGTPLMERAAALAEGREAAARLLRLAPDFGDSYVPWCFLHAEVRIAECEAQLKKGLAVDPRAQSPGITFGKLLLNVGRIDEAVPLARATLAKNPYSPTQIARLLLALEVAGQRQEAETVFKQGNRLRPQSSDLLFQRASGMLARGDFDALSRLDRDIAASGLAPDYKSLAGRLNRAIQQGSPSQAHALCRAVPDAYEVEMIECMLASARLGDLDQSFAFADRLYPRRTGRTTADEEAIWLANPDDEDTLYLVGRGAAAMRRDPRYLELADSLGLIRYWRHGTLPDFCTRDHEPLCSKIVTH